MSDQPSSTARGQERRRHPRIPADWPLHLALDDGEHTARIRDISRAGVCFFLDRAVPVMTLLGVELDLPVHGGPRRIRGNGAVVRCERIADRVDHYEIAVFLHDMLEDDRRELDAFVAQAAAD